jgi:hypothetical protein
LLAPLKGDEEREFFLFHAKALFAFRFNRLFTVARIEPILKDELKIEKALLIVADGKKVDPECCLLQLEEGVVLGLALPPWEGKIVLATDDSPKWIRLMMSSMLRCSFRASMNLGRWKYNFR